MLCTKPPPYRVETLAFRCSRRMTVSEPPAFGWSNCATGWVPKAAVMVRLARDEALAARAEGGAVPAVVAGESQLDHQQAGGITRGAAARRAHAPAERPRPLPLAESLPLTDAEDRGERRGEVTRAA